MRPRIGNDSRPFYWADGARLQKQRGLHDQRVLDVWKIPDVREACEPTAFVRFLVHFGAHDERRRQGCAAALGDCSASDGMAATEATPMAATTTIRVRVFTG
jgi:hypothetical protein